MISWTFVAYGGLTDFVTAATASVLWNGYKLWRGKS